MLIKVGAHRINLAHVACVAENNEGKAAALVRFVSGDSIELIDGDAMGFLKTWDKWAEFQNAAQYVNEYNVSAAIEQIKGLQNKSGIVIPKATIPHRGR